MSSHGTEAVDRARRQIAMGERLAQETGVDRNTCVDAAHFLLGDDGAARQGDDPSWLSRVGLAGYQEQADAIERAAVVGWDKATFSAVIERLQSLGPTRRRDGERLRAHRRASA